MAFVATYQMQHGAEITVGLSLASATQPVRLGMGENSGYLSVEETTRLHMQLGEVLEQLKAADAAVEA